ncbi:MFS transporter [Pseudaminobacter manganicus]|uniref:MFS transporter n=1 Tax=Manganibacter manganicus TaxID=1873176 RepID=A0A1V8RKA7_9HYPH|nr:MFS transporter [Pseudaminobacter manganicus]
MSRFPELLLAAGLGLWLSASVAQGQDATAGEKLFSRCKACHAIGEGAKNRVGPELNGLVGRKAGTVAGYRYSSAMTEAGEGGLVWDEASLRSFLGNPRAFVKGTKMAFPGFKKEGDLANIVAYLKSFTKDGKMAGIDDQAATPARQEAEKIEAPAAQPPQAKAAPAVQQEGAGKVFGLGRLATADEIAAWDIDVRPDGLGLPVGKGTVAQGEKIFDESCSSCHGDFGEAVGRWPVLAGGQGTLKDERPVKTVGSYWPYLSTVYDYIRRAMPFGNARSLSDDDVYALTAYVLYLNDVVTDEDFELSNKNFTSIHLPNEANFIDDNRAQEPEYAQKGEPCMKDCVPGKARITMHAAVLDVTPDAQDGDEAPASGIE